MINDDDDNYLKIFTCSLTTSGSFSIAESLLPPPPLFTTTSVLGADVILRVAPADVDCRRRFTAGRDLLTFWPLFRNFGESNKERSQHVSRV